MKRFALTLLITLGTAFTLFPFFFVLLTWGGDSEGTGGFFASVTMMFFIQFVSPFHLWIVPLGLGSFAALLWRWFNMGSPKRLP
jgi:hypothetical protein